MYKVTKKSEPRKEGPTLTTTLPRWSARATKKSELLPIFGGNVRRFWAILAFRPPHPRCPRIFVYLRNKPPTTHQCSDYHVQPKYSLLTIHSSMISYAIVASLNQAVQFESVEGP